LLPPNEKATGVDVGITNFAMLSDGTHVPNPKFFKEEEKALKRAQRKL
jgi:putative transposase